MSLLLALIAGTGIGLSGFLVDGPDTYVTMGPQLVTTRAEGYPEKITVRVIPPSGATIPTTECEGTSECEMSVDVNEFGIWEFIGTIEYFHKDPDGSPYVYVAAMAATADPQLIFVDGFETGTTEAWSKTL